MQTGQLKKLNGLVAFQKQEKRQKNSKAFAFVMFSSSRLCCTKGRCEKMPRKTHFQRLCYKVDRETEKMQKEIAAREKLAALNRRREL